MRTNYLWRSTTGATALAAVLVVPSALASEVKTSELPSRCLDFAWSSDTGILAAIDPEGQRVFFVREADLDAPTAKAASEALPSMPIALTYKPAPRGNGMFAVVCLDRQELLTFDAATLKPGGAIALSNQKPSGLASSSNPTDPYLYYTFSGGHDAAMAAIDVVRRVDLGKVNLARSAHDSIMDVRISGDGTLAYPRGPWSPSGFSVLKLLPPAEGRGGFAAEQVYREHRGVSGYLPDPYGDMIVCGKTVYAPLLKEKLGELPVDADAFMPGQPIALGLDNGQLVAMSTNTFAVVGRTALPGWPALEPNEDRSERRTLKVPNPSGDFKRFEFAERVFGDASRKTVIVASDAKVWKVPVAMVVPDPEPFLSVAADLPEAFVVGLSTKVTLKPRDPRVKVGLGAAPTGVAINADTLTWTPTADQVGESRLELKLASGAVQRTQVLTVQVVQPVVHLPFPASSVRMSVGGDRAVVWSSSEGFNPDRQREVGTRLAVVDTATRKVVAERSFAKIVTRVAIAADGVFCALRDSDAIQVLKPGDLADAEAIYLNGRPQDMRLIGETWLSVADNNGTVSFVQRPGFKVLGRDALGVSKPPFHFNGSTGLPLWTGDGWMFDGVLYDAALKTPRLVVHPWFFPTVVLGDGQGGPRFGTNERQDGPWGRYMSGPGGIVTAGGRQVAQFQAESTIILSAVPVAVSMRSESAYDGTSNVRTVSLTVRDLVSGSSDAPMVLLKERDQGNHSGFHGGYESRLDSTGARVAAVIDDMLFVINLDAASLKEKPRPLTLRCADEMIAVKAGEPVQIKYIAEGGKPPYEFELLKAIEGLSLDRKTGTLVFESAPAIQTALKQLDRIFLQGGQFGYDPSSPSRVNAARFDAPKAAFARLVGRPAAGVPVAVPVEVVVHDATNESAAVKHALVVEAPQAEIEKLIADKMRQHARPQAPTPADQSQDLSGRIDQLESRLTKLEGKIELLLEALRPAAKSEPDRK